MNVAEITATDLELVEVHLGQECRRWSGRRRSQSDECTAGRLACHTVHVACLLEAAAQYHYITYNG